MYSVNSKASTPIPLEAPKPGTEAILCVELGALLLRTSLAFEQSLSAARQSWRNLGPILGALFKGRCAFRRAVESRGCLNVAAVPVDAELLTWLEEQRAHGRGLVLIADASDAVATAFGRRFGVFGQVFSVRGRSPGEIITTMTLAAAEQGASRYDYVGTSNTPLAIWQGARRSVFVGTTRAAARISPSFDFRASGARGGSLSWLRALRVHQWAKNALVLVPAVAAHRLMEPAVLANAALAFAAFCACASGIYILNDLLDLDSDRAHPSKRRRPFASGELHPLAGVAAAAVLIAGAIGISAVALNVLFLWSILAYVVATTAYSTFIKKIAMVDVLTLAGLYAIRVIGGGAATGIFPSFWLLAFSIFLFLSLAMAKRYAELVRMRPAGRQVLHGRGYETDDLPLLLGCGTSSGYLAVLVLALYVNSGATSLYARPEIIWILCPLLLYWIGRVWLKTHRGQMHDDPVVFALRDRPSQAVVLAFALLFFLAL